MMFQKKNKRGSIFDVLTLMLLPLFMFVAIIVLYLCYSSISTALTDAREDVSINSFNESSEIVTRPASQFSSFWDFLFMFIIFGAFFVTLIISYLLGNHPVFLIFYILSAFALLVFAFVGAGFMEQMVANPPISIYMISFPMTNFFINNFFMFVFVFLLSDGVALYAKTASAGGNYGV